MKQILLKIRAASSFQQEVLRGIGRYSRLHGPWRFLADASEADARLFSLAGLDTPSLDGVLITPWNDGELECLRRRGLPFVCMTYRPGLPMVSNDNAAIGRMAAEHLLDQGYPHLAVAASQHKGYMRSRSRAFLDRADREGVDVRILEGVPDLMDEAIGPLAAFLRSLPTPCGLLADNDIQARKVAEAAITVGIHVPEQLAILGVDNDEPICELTTPPLSSVALNAERIGYEGAAMLDQFMNNRRPPSLQVEIPPLGIEQRQSTSALIIRDRHVAAVLRYIREHPRQAMTVDEVLRTAPLCRRAMERRFLEATGRTIFQEVRRVQLDHVKRLLRETHWEIEMVARRSAFGSAKRLRQVFRDAFGESPTQYRLCHASPIDRVT